MRNRPVLSDFALFQLAWASPQFSEMVTPGRLFPATVWTWPESALTPAGAVNGARIGSSFPPGELPLPGGGGVADASVVKLNSTGTTGNAPLSIPPPPPPLHRQFAS